MAATALLKQCRVTELYLASSSRGVSAHLVVRVVVTALESAPADDALTRENSRAHRSHILTPMPGEKMVRRGDMMEE